MGEKDDGSLADVSVDEEEEGREGQDGGRERVEPWTSRMNNVLSAQVLVTGVRPHALI